MMRRNLNLATIKLLILLFSRHADDSYYRKFVGTNVHEISYIFDASVLEFYWPSVHTFSSKI